MRITAEQVLDQAFARIGGWQVRLERERAAGSTAERIERLAMPARLACQARAWLHAGRPRRSVLEALLAQAVALSEAERAADGEGAEASGAACAPWRRLGLEQSVHELRNLVAALRLVERGAAHVARDEANEAAQATAPH